MSQILLITPPLTQLNTSYPATAQLQGFLRSQGVKCQQLDLSIELINKILTKESVEHIFHLAEEQSLAAEGNPGKKTPKALRIIQSNSSFYCRWVEPVCRFLQGKDLTMQNRFADPSFWPNTKRHPKQEDLEWDYGTSGTYNQAQYLCTLFIEDISMLIQETISRHFEMVRYGEKLCTSLATFDPLLEELEAEPNLIDQWMLEILEKSLHETFTDEELRQKDTYVGLSIPFPGNLYAGLRCAQYIQTHYPQIHITMGGGYVTTELRQIDDARLFQFIDSLTFDDGELPLLRLLTGGELVRTITVENGELIRHGWDSPENISFKEIGAPSLDGLPLSSAYSGQCAYLDTADTANPMQRLWANGRWLKMMMAHGCYWHGCTFCDTCLDYIGRYEAAPAGEIVDRMEKLSQQSGLSGIHFVDEAMPPAVLKKVAEEILQRGLTMNYWGNVRFEKVYTQELCYLLAQSGCIAVSGGIEVASERVLKLINKGVSVASVRETLTHFRDNGIMVHAYLMYGFPTETEKELYESLQTVRDMFADGLIQSAFWHRYAMTCHAPSGRNPHSVGAEWAEPDETGEQPIYAPFANNEIAFECKGAPDWSRFSKGLNLATYNYMRGTGFDVPIKNWFK